MFSTCSHRSLKGKVVVYFLFTLNSAYSIPASYLGIKCKVQVLAVAHSASVRGGRIMQSLKLKQFQPVIATKRETRYKTRISTLYLRLVS